MSTVTPLPAETSSPVHLASVRSAAAACESSSSGAMVSAGRLPVTKWNRGSLW